MTKPDMLLTEQEIEYRESDRLAHLGAFLMRHGTRRRITVNARLTAEEKEEAVAFLLDHLAQTPERTTDAYLWVRDRGSSRSVKPRKRMRVIKGRSFKFRHQCV